jgi:hypothetical protein
MDHIKKIAPWLLAAMLGGFFLLNLHLSWTESAIMDEKAHIPAGYSYVHFGDMRLNPEHPPLLKDLAGLPLLFMDLSFPADSARWQSGINEQWTLGDAFIYGSGNDADRIMFWSRFPIVLIALLLGFFIYRWTKELAGTVAGLFATLLYLADPNIIGHSHYVTTDIGIAAFIFIAFYYFIRFLRDPSWKNLALAGIGLGLAELAKFSAVLLFPYFALIGLLYFITKPKANDGASSVAVFRLKKAWEFIWKYAGIVLISLVLIFALYIPNTINMPGEKLAEISHAVFPQDKAPGKFATDTVSALSVSPVIKPFDEYLLGVFMVFMRVAGGNTYYFFGTVSNHATPWYFPAVFLLKETLPMLFLLLAGLVYTTYRILRSIAGKQASSWWAVFSHSFQSHIAQYAMFGFVLMYAYVSITGNLNIGFRHLFPILPFLYVLVAKTAFDFLRRQGFQGERVVRMLLGVLALWIISIPIFAYPSYLSYFNTAAGGPSEGYRYVTDSNYDWGQDVKRLRDFVDNHNACVANASNCADDAAMTLPAIDQIKVDYFGGTNPKYYLGDKYVEWHSDNGPAPGWYAISIGFYQESTHRTDMPIEKTYDWLKAYSPVALAGDSILIYYVPDTED